MRLNISATPPPVNVELTFWIDLPESFFASDLRSSMLLLPIIDS